MTNNTPIEVLFLDDEADFRSSMQGDAAEKNIILRCYSSLQEGLEELDRNHSIRFVILDAKGFLRPDQVKGTENDSFAVKAHIELEKISNTQNRFLPYCYLTGHSDLRTTYENVGDFIVFDKNDNGVRDKLFDYIWDVINNSEEGSLRKKYGDLFIATDLINHPDAKKSLLNLVKHLETSDYQALNQDLKGIFADVRSLQEMIYKALNRKSKVIIPNHLFQDNGMIKFGDTQKHLTNNNYQHQFVNNIANVTYWGTSSKIHSNLGPLHVPSKFGIYAILLAVFELLLWFKELYSKPQP